MEPILLVLVPFTKVMMMVLQAIYLLFAFMLTRQIKIMNKNFRTDLAGTFTILGFIHFVVAFILLVVTYLFSQ